MKKPGFYCLLAAVVFLLAFLFVFPLWRDAQKPPIQIHGLAQPDATEGTSSQESGLININTASAEQLQLLPGIGPVLAQRIVEYRQREGAFVTVSQLTMVSGIGIVLLDQIMDYITVGG